VGGKGKSVDATDACCKAHNIQSRTNFLRCPLYSAFYSEDLDPKTRLPYCKDTPGSCANHVWNVIVL
ncbi:unnamed protein product, partial [Rotaria sp. Silwood2]